MRHRIHRIRQGVFFAAVAAALGFGAQALLATPASAAPQDVRRCDPVKCNAECKLQTGGIGFCSLGFCYCPPPVPTT